MRVGDTVRFLAVSEDSERVECQAEIIDLQGDVAVIEVTAPRDFFIDELPRLVLVVESIVETEAGLIYAGAYHGGLLVPGLWWRPLQAEDDDQ